MSTSKGRSQTRNPKAPEGRGAEQRGQEGPETIDAETVKKGQRIIGADRAKLAGELTKKYTSE